MKAGSGDERRIRTLTEPVRPSLVPELVLHLATERSPLWRATDADLERLGVTDPYWAFCWGGGQALARHVLDHPHLVRDRRVLDVGAGGGVVAIAAARAGAATVRAVDVDVRALAATRLNAAANGVRIECASDDPIGAPTAGWDVLLAGDMTYEPALARRLVAWMARHAAAGGLALLGDLGRGHLPGSGLEALVSGPAPSDVATRDSHRKRATIYRVEPAAARAAD